MLIGQTPVLVHYGYDIWLEEGTYNSWLCNRELENLTGRKFPYKIRVMLFDRPAKGRHAIDVKNKGIYRVLWFDAHSTINKWRPFFPLLDHELAKILPLGEHKLFFQVKRI